MPRHLLLFTLWFFLILPTWSQVGDIEAKLSQVDTLFEEWKGERPGGAVGIVYQGNTLYEKYFGLANLETGEAFSERTQTDIGSVSKQFTAFCIALLEEKQKLSIHDDIRTYLPEFPFYKDTVKIKHLLYHTSGLKDQEELVKIKGLEPYGAHMTNDYAVQLLSRQKSLNFSPGSIYEYSNANYVLLTEIVERLSGKGLEKFAETSIFEPLGMNHSFFNRNQGEVFPHRAWGYFPIEGTYTPGVYESHIIGDGGIFTTLKDMIRWDQNFFHNQLGKSSPELTERMKYREPLRDGREIGMAFGQIRTPHPFGELSWSHGGSGGGYRSFYIRFEGANLSVIVLSNADDGDSFGKANAIAELFLDNREVDGPIPEEDSPPTPSPQIPTLPTLPEMIQLLPGYYLNPKQLEVIQIEYLPVPKEFSIEWLGEGSQRYAALPIDSLSLGEVEDLAYAYTLDKSKGNLTHTIKGRVASTFKKLSLITDLGPYQGTYYSEELDHSISLEKQKGLLSGGQIYLDSLQSIGSGYFRDLQTGALISFSKDAQGMVQAFQLDVFLGDRSLRNLRFQKTHP